MPRDDVEDSGFIFNQRDRGLAVKNAKGEIVELADISLICRNPISTHDLKLKGYLWLVQYNRKNKIQKSVFIEKKANMKPAVFEQAIDSQHGLAFRMDIGRYGRYWSRFVSEKVERGKILIAHMAILYKLYVFMLWILDNLYFFNVIGVTKKGI